MHVSGGTVDGLHDEGIAVRQVTVTCEYSFTDGKMIVTVPSPAAPLRARLLKG